MNQRPLIAIIPALRRRPARADCGGSPAERAAVESPQPGDDRGQHARQFRADEQPLPVTLGRHDLKQRNPFPGVGPPPVTPRRQRHADSREPCTLPRWKQSGQYAVHIAAGQQARFFVVLWAVLLAVGTIGCTHGIDGQAEAAPTAPPPVALPAPPPTFPIPTANAHCAQDSRNTIGHVVCSDWVRPPEPISTWPSLMNWVGRTYKQGHYIDYADDYLCALTPDTVVRNDFGANGYRYLLNLIPSCQIATSDNTRVIAEISIQNGEGLADYAHFCNSPGLDFACTMTPVTIDGRAGMEEHVTDPLPHTGGHEVFFAVPGYSDSVLDINVDVDMTSPRSSQDPIPALSPDTAQTYADHVFNDLASIFIPASR
jgi:hypothetical protein